MKIVTEKKCIKCGHTKSWTNYSPCWGKTEAASFIRRICKDCETSFPAPVEAHHLQRELDGLLKKRARWEGKIREINELIDERLQQVETATKGGENEPPLAD